MTGCPTASTQILMCSLMDTFQSQETTGENTSSSNRVENSDAGVYKCSNYKQNMVPCVKIIFVELL